MVINDKILILRWSNPLSVLENRGMKVYFNYT